MLTEPESEVQQTSNEKGLRRNANFLLLWSSAGLSMMTTRAAGVAYPLLALALTGSAATAGWVAFAATVPDLVLYLLAGPLVDRWNWRRTMLICEAGRALAVGSIALSIFVGKLSIAQIVAVAFVEGSFGVLYKASEQVAVKGVVSEAHLTSALAANETRTHAALMAGRSLAGMFFLLAVPSLSGGIVGSLLATWVYRKLDLSLIVVQILIWVAAFAIPLIGVASAPISVTLFAVGFAGSLGNVAASSYIMRQAPQGMLGRIFSVSLMAMFFGYSVGPVVGGQLITHLGVQGTALTDFAAMLILALWATTVPAFRTPGQSTDKSAAFIE